MASETSNTIYVPVLEGCEICATRVAFERFGEVAEVHRLPDKNPALAAVVFFDVRSAARAVETLGDSYCSAGPQTGCRTVELPGNKPFDAADFENIMNIVPDEEGGKSYIVDFFDIRDAARYREQLVNPEAESPVVSAHPELASVGPPPPGLSLPMPAVCEVQIAGIPSELLSNEMVKTTLEQAGFFDDVVVGFSTKAGKSHGKLTVQFSCPFAAETCALYFEGCEWLRLRDGLSVELRHLGEISDMPSDASIPGMSFLFDTVFADFGVLAFRQPWEAGEDSELSPSDGSASGVASEATPSTSLSAEAPEWIPVQKLSKGLTAEAPVFVPGAISVERFEEVGSPRKRASARGRKTQKPEAPSDTSTEIGESEDERHEHQTSAASEVVA